MTQSAIDYGQFKSLQPEVYEALRRYDERAEADAGLPKTPGVLTERDLAAINARDPQAVRLIAATVQSTSLALLNDALRPRPNGRSAVVAPVPAPVVDDNLVGAAIAQSVAAGSVEARDAVLEDFCRKYSAQLSGEQVRRIVKALYFSNNKDRVALEFIKANHARISVEAVVNLAAATSTDGRGEVLLAYGRGNADWLRRDDLTALANAAYYSVDKAQIVKIAVNP